MYPSVFIAFEEIVSIAVVHINAGKPMVRKGKRVRLAH